MNGAITGFERRPLGASDLAEGVVNGFERERGVQPSKGVAQSPLEHDLAVVGAFGGQLTGGDLGTVCDLPPEAAEPVEGGILDDGFGEACHQGRAREIATSRMIRGLTPRGNRRIMYNGDRLNLTPVLRP